MRTGVEVNNHTHDGKGNRSGDEVGTGTGTRVKTRGRTQD